MASPASSVSRSNIYDSPISAPHRLDPTRSTTDFLYQEAESIPSQKYSDLNITCLKISRFIIKKKEFISGYCSIDIKNRDGILIAHSLNFVINKINQNRDVHCNGAVISYFIKSDVNSEEEKSLKENAISFNKNTPIKELVKLAEKIKLLKNPICDEIFNHYYGSFHPIGQCLLLIKDLKNTLVSFD